MSQFMKVTYAQADAARNDLSENLQKQFTAAVGGPVHSFTVGRISTAEWGISVGISRALTRAEKKALPTEYEGVKVSYKIEPPFQLQ